MDTAFLELSSRPPLPVSAERAALEDAITTFIADIYGEILVASDSFVAVVRGLQASLPLTRATRATHAALASLLAQSYPFSDEWLLEQEAGEERKLAVLSDESAVIVS